MTTLETAYCTVEGCRNVATTERVTDWFDPVTVNGADIDHTVETVCEDHQ